MSEAKVRNQGDERVVLLSDSGEPVGTMPKSEVHGVETPLHLAFSCHLFDEAGRLLLTRRALGKIAWPGVWTNSFCGHPAPGEPMDEAVHRRAAQELGVEIACLREVLPDFRYRAVDAGGIMENEVCPVFAATVTSDPAPAADEVCDWVWADPHAVAQAVRSLPRVFSPWLVLQLPGVLGARGQGR